MNRVLRYSLCGVMFFITLSVSFAVENTVKTHFTNFFMGGTQTDFDTAFNQLRTNEAFIAQAEGWTQAALAAVPQLNFQPLEKIGSAAGVTAKVEPNTIFVRGLVSRGDVKRIQRFSIDEYVISLNMTLEFFDLASGEVYYTRTLTGQSYFEKAKNSAPSVAEKKDYFRQCFRGTIEALVKRIGEDYRPGVVEGRILAAEDSTIVLDLGRKAGVYQGMTFYIFSDDGKPAGLLKTESPEEKICSARLIINQGGPLKRGMTVRSFGVNSLLQQKGQTRCMVAGFAAPVREGVHPDFDIDTQSMGQWLHDGLSSKTDLFMLAPLLVKLDQTGSVQTQEALWEAQLNYSVFGGLAQSAAMWRRAIPDVMVIGVVTHAGVQEYITPGAVNKILEVGVSVEFYDRKTRDYLYSRQHSNRKVEKVVKAKGKTYREIDLAASFRDLCKDVIREAAVEIGENYKPMPTITEVVKLQSDSVFIVMLPSNYAGVGNLFSLYRETGKYQGLNGENLGALHRNYGIAKILDPRLALGELAQLVVSDGLTQVMEGDMLICQGKSASQGRGALCQVSGWRVQGEVSGEYRYSLPRLTEWLHDALSATRRYRLLPPVFREGDMGTAEAGMALGQFEAAGHREIVYQGFRMPEAIITGRLGLADIQIESGEFKNKIKLRVGVEISFITQTGDTLFTKKLVGKREIEQTKRSGGEVAVGTEDLSPEFDSLAKSAIEELAGKIAEEFLPISGQ